MEKQSRRRQIKYGILGVVDRFIHPSLKQDPAILTRAQILVGVVILNIFTGLLTAAAIRAGMNLNFHNSLAAYSIIAYNVLLYVVSLLLVRGRGAFLAGGNIATLSVFSTIVMAAMVTGGFRDSPFIQLFVLVPVLAFLFAGLTSGIGWSLLTLVVLCFLLFGEHFPELHYQMLNKNDAASFRRFMPFVMATMVTFALVIYELISQRLKRQLNRERNRFAFRASHDSLTDLPNRSEFYMRLRHGLEDVEISQTSLALIYIDLDGFKPINDNHGHHAGDKVLKVLASRLRGVVRQQDTVARLGGDEFALILTGVTRISDVEQIIQKTLAAIAEPIEIDGQPLVVHGSAGIAMSPLHGTDSDRLCRLADQAMYRAKETRNTFRFSEGTNPRINAIPH